MRDLAREAGVSHATPFNLFGSKAAVIAQILEADVDAFQAALEANPATDPLDAFFEMARMASRYLRVKGTLYRTLYLSFQETAADPLFRRATERRRQVVFDIVENAQRAGILRLGLSAELMSLAVFRMFEAVLMDWVHDLIEVDRLEHEICFSFCALLSGFATPSTRDLLMTRMEDYQSAVPPCEKPVQQQIRA